MSYLRFTLGFAAMAVACGAFAQTMPNSGTVARDAQDKPAGLPASPPLSNAVVPPANSTDATPIAVKSVRIVGATLFTDAQLSPIVADAAGQTLTLGQLQALAQRVTAFYQAHGYPLSRAVLPAQKLTAGVVTIEVIEGKIAQTQLDNRSRVADAVLQSYLARATDANGMMRQDKTERALLLIKDLAGTEYVGYRLAAGDKQGESRLHVNLQPAPLVNGSISEDNHGSESTGEWRTRAGVNLNSPFGYGEQLSVQAMTSLRNGKLGGVNYGRFSWRVPLGSDGWSWNGGWSHTDYDLGGAFAALNALGHANTLQTGVSYPVIRSEKTNLSAAVQFELSDMRDEVRATNTLTDKSKQAVQLDITASHQDDFLGGGLTQIGLNSRWGRLSIDSPSALAIDAVSAKTHGDFHKFNASISRQQFVLQDFSVVAQAQFQWASKNMDSSEQMSLGGASGVSAYHSNDVSGDQGWLAKLEARYQVSPQVSVSGFYDWGAATINTNPYQVGVSNQKRLHGGGVGVQINHKGFELQLLSSWAKRQFSTHREPRVSLQMSYRF